MTKAALLSTCGDVFITSLLLELWNRDWRDEVDRLYINFNNHCGVPPEVVGEFVKNIASDPKITLIHHSNGIGNGPPQVELLKICNEDLILLLEDDFFIFTTGIVSGCFKKIENGEYDVLGSPRYSYGEVADAAKKKFNLDYSGIGDKGFGWWPTGFYCKKKDLLKTDLDFGSKKYPKGQYFKELDHTFETDNYTDTFTWASIQLRAMGLRSMDIPQYHAMPFIDDQCYDIPYIHAGSLSAGWGGYLSGTLPDVSHDIAKQEIESRVAWWIIAVNSTDQFSNFAKEYIAGINHLINATKLNQFRINKKIQLYKKLIKL